MKYCFSILSLVYSVETHTSIISIRESTKTGLYSNLFFKKENAFSSPRNSRDLLSKMEKKRDN